jgi:tetratricopeptide (TPR) repeat protein
LGGDDPQTILAVSLFANVARKLGRFEEARDLHMKTLEWVESQESADSVNVAALAMQVGSLMVEWHEFDQASEFFRRALDIRQKALGPDDPDTLSSLRWLALIIYRCGKIEAATTLAEELAERSARTLGPEARESVMAQDLLARFAGSG